MPPMSTYRRITSNQWIVPFFSSGTISYDPRTEEIARPHISETRATCGHQGHTKEVKLTGGVVGQKPLGRTDRGPVDLVQAQGILQRWHGGTWPLLGMGAGVGGGHRNWREMLQFQGGRAQLAWD